jgi:cytochrome c oxidase subunit 4
MSDAHSKEEITKHVWIYKAVFYALLVGTLITVGMYAVHFDSMYLTIAIALAIATVKASLVAGFFMHLSSEKKSIYTVLAITVFFFAGLMGLTIWAMHDFPEGTQNTQLPQSVAAPAHVP